MTGHSKPGQKRQKKCAGIAQDTQDRTPRQDKQDTEDRTSWTGCSAETVNDIGNNKFAKLENENQYYNIELCVWIELLSRIDQL